MRLDTAVAPIPQPGGMITGVAYGCGPGRTRVHRVCVARTRGNPARIKRSSVWLEGSQSSSDTRVPTKPTPNPSGALWTFTIT
jgi:hypothetical protein